MDPSPHLVRTGRKPARPRNLIAGVLGVLALLLSCGLCGRGVRSLDAAGAATGAAATDSAAVAP